MTTTTTLLSQHVLALLRQIEAKTIRSAVDDRVTEKIGPFMAAAHPDSDMIWLSYAIPLSDERAAGDVEGAVPRLREWFAARKRRLRMEILEPLWPELAARLIACGVALQGRMPIMLCAPADLKPAPIPAAVTIVDVDPSVRHADLLEIIAIARRSFGEDEPTFADVARNRESLAAGRHRSAVAWLGGVPVGVGSMSVGNDELVGVATPAEFRGRGIAAAISHHLCADHFARGASLVWLSAGDDRARRVYHRIGFTAVGDQINLIDPV
jgi:GNAT superfamily N-acetyltransferase